MLAVTLGHIDSAVVLLQHEANVNTENTQGWTGNLPLYFFLSVTCLDVCIFHNFIYFHYINSQFNLFWYSGSRSSWYRKSWITTTGTC